MADDAAGPGPEQSQASKRPSATRLSKSDDNTNDGFLRMRQISPDADDLSWLGELNREFGWQLLASIACSMHLMKGICKGFCNANWTYIIKEYSIPATSMNVYEGVVQLPWALKPVIGFLSDCFPIYGYSKLPYILCSTIIGFTSFIILGTFQRSIPVDWLVACLFNVSMAVSSIDLLTEALYAKALRDKPDQGPAMMTFVWGGLTLIGIVATVTAGLVISFGSPWSLYTYSAMPFVVMLVPIMKNWYGDPYLSDAQVQAQRMKVLDQIEAAILAFIMLGATLVLAYSGMMLSVRQNALISSLVLAFVLFSFSSMLHPVVAKVNAFGLIQASFNSSLGSAAFFFMLDDESQFPDGPHFTRPFISIVLPLVGSVCSVYGIILYNQHAGSWTYQKMYIIGNLLVVLTSFVDILFFLRLNKQVGLPDHVLVVGSTSFQSVVDEWLWIPSVALLAQLCPRGMEAIMYANLASCHNLGNTISNNFGALLLELNGVEPSGALDEQDQFDNLWFAALISTCLPLLSVLLVPWCIPDKLNTQPVIDDPAFRINEGSLLCQWMGWDESVAADEHHKS